MTDRNNVGVVPKARFFVIMGTVMGSVIALYNQDRIVSSIEHATAQICTPDHTVAATDPARPGTITDPAHPISPLSQAPIQYRAEPTPTPQETPPSPPESSQETSGPENPVSVLPPPTPPAVPPVATVEGAPSPSNAPQPPVADPTHPRVAATAQTGMPSAPLTPPQPLAQVEPQPLSSIPPTPLEQSVPNNPQTSNESAQTPQNPPTSAQAVAPSPRQGAAPAPQVNDKTASLGPETRQNSAASSENSSVVSPSRNVASSSGPFSFSLTKVRETRKFYLAADRSDGKIVLRTGGNVSWRFNNPGRMLDSDFARKMGAIGSDGTTAIFPTYDIGKTAMETYLFTDAAPYHNQPLNKIFTKDNLNFVLHETKLPPTLVLDNMTSDQREKLLSTIEKMEGYIEGKVSVFPNEQQFKAAGW